MKKFWFENKWVIIFSLFVIVITTIPYWIGFNLQNEIYKFSGFIIGVEDGNSYLAKMMLGASGDWLFTTPYTAYPQMKFFAFFPYILLGKLTSAPEQTLQFICLFHLFRWMGILFLIKETYSFSLLFVKEKNTARVTTALLVFGGGLGWLSIVYPQIYNNRLPLEFYSPETFGYLSFFSLPHLLFARGYLYRAFRILLTMNNKNDYPSIGYLKSGLSLLLSGIFQPLNIFIGWLIVGSFYLYKLVIIRIPIKNLKEYLLWIIPSVPLFFYNFFSFLFDPYLSAWQNQNRIISPPVVDYLLAYGMGLLFIFFAIKHKEIMKMKNLTFINIWIFLIPVLAYFPINIQRRLTEGVWLCFCIYIGMVVINNKKFITRFIIVTFFMFSYLFFTIGSLRTVLTLNPPIYNSNSFIDVANSLDQEIVKGDVILAPYNESNLLPVYLPIKVITGHGPESKNLSGISKSIASFYQGKLSSTETQDLLVTFDIKYIIIPQELDLNNIFLQLEGTPRQIFYKNSDYAVVRLDD
ncbi:MAG: hypothetical protein Q7U53_06355 [Anaerolineaceae bacterium]|nr:hypothetical protein [Anaerolineaceae bacterium]